MYEFIKILGKILLKIKSKNVKRMLESIMEKEGLKNKSSSYTKSQIKLNEWNLSAERT